MFLRNKLAILSVTLMSLMTIPTLAENDTSTVTSRIENTRFDVQVNIPEGWSETKDFNQAIPDSFELGDHLFRGVKFKNSTENHGCAVFFGTDTFFDDDEVRSNATLQEALKQAQELAFPGLKHSTFKVLKVKVDGSFAADVQAETANIDAKGTLEGDFLRETGDSSKLTITGTVKADSIKGDVAVGTGTIVSEGAVPFCGTTGVQINKDYNIVIVIWGSDEESQVRDTQRFLQAVTVTPKAPTEVAFQPVIELIDIVVVVVETSAEPVVEVTSVAVSEPAAETTNDVVAAAEPVVEVTSDAVAVSEPAAETTNDAVAAAEPVVEEVVATPEASA